MKRAARFISAIVAMCFGLIAMKAVTVGPCASLGGVACVFGIFLGMPAALILFAILGFHHWRAGRRREHTHLTS